MAFWKRLRATLPWHRSPAEGQSAVQVRRYPTDLAALSVPGRLEEDEEAFTLMLETPGFDTKDLAVSVSPDRIVVDGKRVEEEGSPQGQRWSHREGLLHVEVPLAANVEQAKATAGLKHGVLTVHLPKTEEARRSTRQIPIAS